MPGSTPDLAIPYAANTDVLSDWPGLSQSQSERIEELIEAVPLPTPATKLTVTDTPTVNLTVSGNGTTTPFNLSAAATLKLKDLTDVSDTDVPVNGDVPVWRTDRWEFEAGPAAGVPFSGVWGTAPLDQYGSDSLVGREIYVDANNQLRGRPEVIEMGAGVNLNTVLATGKWTQSGSAEATLVLNYPIAQAGLLEVTSLPTGTTMVWQRYTVHGHATYGGLVFERSLYNGTWQPWRVTAGSVHYAAYKTTPQTMPVTDTFYVATFPNTEANVGGITNANGVFTLPVAGSYAVNFSTHIVGTTASSIVGLDLMKNGSSMGDYLFRATNTNKNWGISRVMKCAVGDTLSARARVNPASASTTMHGQPSTKYTLIDITLVGG